MASGVRACATATAAIQWILLSDNGFRSEPALLPRCRYNGLYCLVMTSRVRAYFQGESLRYCHGGDTMDLTVWDNGFRSESLRYCHGGDTIDLTVWDNGFQSESLHYCHGSDTMDLTV
ncbi:Hypothetical predicted protein [Pelobates cultripes]|uniref:Uncharacterized protein n=1 Tax=Pelobates cultripes TaxID=61616 RepID=A0AAD1WWM7_PELCU|nr:Hypothetical predicted protein [Pelobates cultripes]